VDGGDLTDLAMQMYRGAAVELHASGQRIFCERIFATAAAMPEILDGRRMALGLWCDDVPPVCIVVEEGELGCFAGIQIHAVDSSMSPMVIRRPDDNRTAVGRQINIRGDKWLMLSGLSGQVGENPALQTRHVFDEATLLLRQSGGSFDSVARTWLWLKDVCDWYNDLNRVRTQCFIQHGLIDPGTRKSRRLPASTGIGLYGQNGAAITMDLIALPGREDEIQYVEAGGDQRSAYEYGSAFSRAAVAPMPAGNTVYISGTAAIDPAGVTEDIDHIPGQVDKTVAHVQSLLRDLKSNDEHVSFALVYCKTTAVQQYFLKQHADLPWPMITMIGDVCRPELLFEIEVTASQKES
jgi:enamine deaminase RidA (YjgF/YER057c/UK114 family)